MSSRVARTTTQENFMVSRRLKDHQLDYKLSGEQKVHVVYYLCRSGQLDHPHFIEVPLSSHHGLYLRALLHRLLCTSCVALSSSCFRIYKNGFVWHDVSKDDVIFPIHGQEYILKGSRILDFDCFRRLNQSWSITDLNEYKVYKSSETTAESTCKLATDVSTQTDDHRRRKKPAKEKKGCSVNEITELSREETVLPPQLDSRPKTLETLLKAEGVLMLGLEDQESNRTVENLSSGKMAVLMQLLSCGAVSFKQCVPTLMTGHTGCAIERGARKYKLERAEKELRSFGRVNLEEDEYFSGSLIAESNNCDLNRTGWEQTGCTSTRDQHGRTGARCLDELAPGARGQHGRTGSGAE
ncbi:hypothetical protein Bca52824_010730 [Brassica carinata]|uniref:SOSEKI DIX-like domain-containing protein n=1 Tax=Brassica carinata TaxID=52824 RepID=A0A8X8BBI3_BRACI|nr:hypothetical protein Bca52824_010730 [Brassica carinata]